MKMRTLITPLDRSIRIVAVVLGLATVLVSAGCESIIADVAAGVQYDNDAKAMQHGRMSPSEFNQEQYNVQRALNGAGK